MLNLEEMRHDFEMLNLEEIIHEKNLPGFFE